MFDYKKLIHATFSTGVNVCATANVLIGGVAVPVIAFLGVTIVITGPAAIVLGVGGTALTYGRYRHGESLSLRDRKNRHVWLSFVSGSLGLVGSVGIGYLLTPIIARKVYMAQSGTVTIFQRIAYDACVYTRLLFSFASLLDMLEELVSSGRKPTRMELLQMSVSIFFLTKSLVTFKTCTGLIRSLQDERFQSALAGKSSHAQEVLKATRARVRGLMPFNPEESGNTMVRVVNIGEEKPEVLEMYIDQFAEFLKLKESEIEIVTTHSGSYDLPTTTEGIDLLVYSDGTTTTHHVDSQSQRTIKAVLDFRNMRFQKLDRTDTIEMHTVVKTQNKTYLWFDKQYRDTDIDQYRSYDQNTYFVDLNGQGYAVHNHIADKWQISHYHHHWESENFALDLALSALKSAIISWGNPGAIFIGIWATMANYMASKLDDPALRFCLNFVSSVVSAAALDCNAAANSAANLATNSAGSALVTKEFFTRALVKNCITLAGKTMAQMNQNPYAQFAVNAVTDVSALCMNGQEITASILTTTVGSDAAFTIAHNTDNESLRFFSTAAGTCLNSASQYQQQGKSGLNVFKGPAVAGNLGKSIMNYTADKISAECGPGSPEAQIAGIAQVVANSAIDTQVAILEEKIEIHKVQEQIREALESQAIVEN
ncbi:hypothetical protein Ddc_15225 [Ditylenchus destructor]|nr:hypothetical protein Ddc_15225 [Ditylenchus destructor]